ncbi:MAG: hypothetical protein ACHQNV_05785 [Vicinamibacteria bacterium]
MSLRDRRALGAAAVATALLGLAWLWFRPVPSAVGTASTEERAQGKAGAIPRIDLARIDASRSPSGAGDIDVFQFGAPSTKIVVRATPPPPVVTPPVVANGPDVADAPTPVPVMNVHYIGTVADKKGLKVVVLMTDRKEILTGRAGDWVANRLKIVSIGVESVDVQDMGSDHVRRIPLRAN